MTTFSRLLSLLAIASMSPLADAAIVPAIQVNLLQTISGGASFSWLHSANGSTTSRATNGNTAQIGGSQNNALIGSFDTVTEILTLTNPYANPNPLNHNALTLSSGKTIAANSFFITGGAFQMSGNATDYVGGFLSYLLNFTDNTMDSGNIYFANRQEGSGPADGTTPNSGVYGINAGIVTIDIAEWGNN